MAKRITLKDVKHVDFVPADFLAEIALNPDWKAEDIGCYFTLCLHLYSNGGELELDIHRLAKMCRTTPSRFVKTWDRISFKFTKSGSRVYQKRVRNELQAARKRMQAAVTSGLIGAKRRWGAYSDPNRVAIAKRNEAKTKQNYTKRNETKASDSVKNSHSATLRFAENLEKLLPPFSKSDRTAYVNLIRWLDNEISVKRFDENIYEDVLECAKQAKTGKSRNPIAVFFGVLKEKIGYGARTDK